MPVSSEVRTSASERGVPASPNSLKVASASGSPDQSQILRFLRSARPFDSSFEKM